MIYHIDMHVIVLIIPRELITRYMNKKIFDKVVLALLMLFLVPGVCWAQTVQCTQKLNEAGILYDEGRLLEVLDKLEEANCMRNGFTKEQLTRAYRLQALVYIFMDDEPNAEDAIVKLLLVDPEHPLDASDPAELHYLYNKYRSKPIFRLGGFLGVNSTSVNSLSEYTTSSQFGNNKISKSFSPSQGFHVGATIEYMPIENLELIFRLKFSRRSYVVGNEIITQDETLDASDFKISGLSETMDWISTPLAVRYNFPLKKVEPYVIAGASFDYLLASSISGSREGGAPVDVSGHDMLALDMREKVNWTTFFGGGVKFEFQRIHSFFLEATYGLGGVNIVNGANRYASQELIWNIGYVDDDMTINGIDFSAGMIFSIYKPKKFSEKKLLKLSEKRLAKESKKRD